MIERQNYVLNSLRKNRTECFEKDLEQMYGAYENLLSPEYPESKLTVQLFDTIFIKYFFKCIGEQQDEQEFAQHLYEIILKKFFLSKSRRSKIFAIFSLYFSFYSSENRRKIAISKIYLQQFKQFVKANSSDNNCHYLKIIVHLNQQCFQPCTKAGIKNPIVKPNGDPVKPSVSIKVDPFVCTNHLRHQIDSLKTNLQQYTKQKQKLKDVYVELGQNTLDKHFLYRVQQSLNKYQNSVVNNN